MRVELNQSSVVFQESDHTYISPDFRLLHGITGMLHKQLFPDVYTGVSEEVLRRAAERGTLIHKRCEDYDNGNKEITCDEVYNYALVCFENELKHEASEYIVSDNEYFASAIDKVYRVSDNEFILADIKTTSVLNLDYVRWQLSIYAYLFTRQNPTAKVVGLSAVWLRGDKYKYERVEPVPEIYIEELLTCEREGEMFAHPELAKASSAIALPNNVIERFCLLREQMEQVTADFEHVKSMLMEQMLAHKVKSWDCEAFKATVVPESVSVGFDAKRFEQDNPELFEKYKTKETKRKASIKLTFR